MLSWRKQSATPIAEPWEGREKHKIPPNTGIDLDMAQAAVKGPRIAPGPFLPPTELMARCDHPLKFRRGVIFPLSFKTLLVRLEVGDVTADLLALRSRPIDRWYPVRFDDGARNY